MVFALRDITATNIAKLIRLYPNQFEIPTISSKQER